MAQPHSNLLSALHEAQEQGFITDYFLNEAGQFVCTSADASSPHIIEIVPCLSCGATLYLIADKEHNGTWVHHWDI